MDNLGPVSASRAPSRSTGRWTGRRRVSAGRGPSEPLYRPVDNRWLYGPVEQVVDLGELVEDSEADD